MLFFFFIHFVVVLFLFYFFFQQCDLWNLASAPEVSSKDFYVESLANVITPSHTEPGRLLQHVSQIPGRMKTPPHVIRH